MNTEELIADLAGRLQPVRPLPPIGRRASVWAAVVLVTISATALLFGARPDIRERLVDLRFVWTLIIAALCGSLAGIAALVLAVPGAERSKAMRATALGLVLFWGASLGVMTAQDPSGIGSDAHWPACFLRVIVGALLPGIALAVMIRQGAALRPSLSGLLAAVAAAAWATIAVQVACPIDEPGHGLLGHFLPLVVLGVAGLIAGKRILSLDHRAQNS